MKDKNFIIFLVCVTTILAFITLGSYTYNIYNVNKMYEDKERAIERKQQEIQEQEKQKINEQAEYENFLNENVYDNDIPISFYTFNGMEYVKTSDLYCNWSMDNILADCYAIASTEDTLNGINFETIFRDNWDKHEKSSEYKIGYNIKIQLDKGNIIDKTILEPKDTDELFSYIQVYLYDNITFMPNKLYYHITQEELLPDTMLTSIELVGSNEIERVNGPIELTVFTYNGNEDFDTSTGKYLGNSKFTLNIYRQ